MDLIPGGGWSARPFFLPEFRRIAFEACYGFLINTTLRRAILLSGPRRVGKTTVLQQMADTLVKQKNDPKSILNLSLDHPLLTVKSTMQGCSFVG